MDNKRKDGKMNAWKKALLPALAIGIIPVLLSWFHLAYPYFYVYKWLKLAMYSVTMLIPATIEIALFYAGLKFGEIAFLVLVYIVHAVMYYFIIKGYMRSKNRKRYARILIASVIAYVVLCLFLLW